MYPPVHFRRLFDTDKPPLNVARVAIIRCASQPTVNIQYVRGNQLRKVKIYIKLKRTALPAIQQMEWIACDRGSGQRPRWFNACTRTISA